MSTGDGLDHVLAGVITGRDPVLTPRDKYLLKKGHGTALDRVSAFQIGFVGDSAECAAIDMDEINQRRGDLPMSLQIDREGDVETGEVPIDQDTLSTLMDAEQALLPQSATDAFADARGLPRCARRPSHSVCPASNTITVDLAALQNSARSKTSQTTSWSKVTTPRYRWSCRDTCWRCSASAASRWTRRQRHCVSHA
jgi:hypothetical protein